VPPSASRSYKERPVVGPRGAACPRRDSNAHCPPPQGGASCRWATRTWSRHPVPTRVTRLTRARPQPCAAAKLAILASNQETPGPGPGGSAIFPQWPSGAEGASRTRKPRGLSSRGIPVPFTPAWCATRDLNPDRHRLRACRSAIELAARGADDRNRTGIHCLEGSNTSHCVTSAWWLPQVATLPLLLFRQPLIRLS
jgi:hypothetical protein